MRYKSLLGLLVCGMIMTAFSADIFVSTTGNDEADGLSQSTAFATIAKARDKADELKAGGPVTVYILEGTHYLDEPLEFGSANSGTADALITYKGIGNAVISGGILLPASTQWTPENINGITAQKTTIAKNLHIDQLFLNGKRQIMARYPNFDPNVKILNGYSSDAINEAKFSANPSEGPGYIRALHHGMWGGQSYYFESGSTEPVWVGDNNRTGAWHTDYQMAENIFEFLNAPGEWFYRRSTGELWFYPPQGTDLGSSKIELAALTELVRFTGGGPATENSVKYITFDNITFTHTYRSQFDGTGQFYELITGSDWGLVRKGAVFMQNAEEIRIQNCLFDQVGGNGVFMSGYNRHNVVFNTVFRSIGATAVHLVGLRSSIRCPNEWITHGAYPDGRCPSGDREPGPLTNEYPSYCVVENCLMDSLGIFEKQIAGVNFSATEFDTVRHNSITHIPRAGINFCDGCWGGHLVEYNWVYDCIRESGDHGPFNAWGRDRNLIFGQADLAASKLDARNPTVVRLNRFESPEGFFGIDLDDQATNYYQEKNLLIGGGYKLQWNRYNTYLNGILIGGANVQFHGIWDRSNHYGARNIMHCKRSCIYQTFSMDAQGVANSGTFWDSNAVYFNGGAPNITGWTQDARCNSQVSSWNQWVGVGLDVHSITNVDPGFVDENKTWPGRSPEYLPRGDFNPTNQDLINRIKFETFPMDSFGIVTSVPGPDITTTVGLKGVTRRSGTVGYIKRTAIRYSARCLSVSCVGEYKVTIMNPAGRTVATFKGKGNSDFLLDNKRYGSGLYFAVVRTAFGAVSHRFVASH